MSNLNANKYIGETPRCCTISPQCGFAYARLASAVREARKVGLELSSPRVSEVCSDWRLATQLINLSHIYWKGAEVYGLSEFVGDS